MSEETAKSFSITSDEFNLNNVKQEPQVKEEPLSDDETYSGPSSSFDSYGSALTNYSYENESAPDLAVVKTEYPAEETAPGTVAEVEATSPVPEAVFPAGAVAAAVLPEPEAAVPVEQVVQDSDPPAELTVLPIASTALPIGSSALPDGSAVLPTESGVLPAGSAVLPVESAVLPAGSTVLSAGSTVLPTGSTVLPAGSTVLSTGSTVLPAGSTVLSTGSTVLPAESTVLSSGSTVLSTGSTVLPAGSTVLPVGSTVLPLAQIKLAEAPLTEVNSVQTSSDQMVNIKLVSSNGDVTFQKVPAFPCGSLATMQSGNDQLAIGKVKRFTVTRKLIPSHFVLQKDPSNNMKLTLHHAPNVPARPERTNNVKGLIRLRPVASSPKLCLPVTGIKTLKTVTINVVKAAPATASVPRTVEIKKRLHLVPLNSGNLKGNISAVQ